VLSFFLWTISFVRPRRRLSSAPTVISDADARRGCQGRPSLRHRGRTPAFPGRALTASSTAAGWMITGRKSARLSSLVPLLFARVDCVAARSTVLYAVTGSLAAPWPQGFDAAMSRTQLACTKNRAVVEARPGRDTVPPRDAAENIRSTSGGWRCSLDVPLERRAGDPHAVQDDGKLAGNRHRCLLSPDAFAKALAPGL
jgi:hypothetical protein